MALITSPTRQKYILHAKSLPRVSLLSKDWERSKSSERLSGLPSTIDRVRAARKYPIPVALGPGWDAGRHDKVMTTASRWFQSQSGDTFVAPRQISAKEMGGPCVHTKGGEYFIIIIVYIHSPASVHTHRNAFSMIKCSSSGKPLHRAETDVSMLIQWEISTSPHWVKSNQLANIFLQSPKNDAISQSRKGYISMKSTACGKYRLQIWRTLSLV